MEVYFNSEYAKNLLLKIENLKKVNIPVFIFGEVGTGKEFIGDQILNKYSKIYKTQAELLENDIFFQNYTESIRKNELCGFYISQIEKLSIHSQRKLLKEIQKNQSISRFIFSSQKSSNEILQYVDENFYYFFSPVNVYTVPLEKRKEDILVFIRIFTDTICQSLGRKKPNFSSDILQFLSEYSYKKNLNELKSTLRNLLILNRKKKFQLLDLPPQFFFHREPEDLEIKAGISLETYEREIIKKNLLVHNKNRKRTAKVLDISLRNLYRKIQKYNF